METNHGWTDMTKTADLARRVSRWPWRRWLAVPLVLGAVLGAASCRSELTQNGSGVFLIVDDLAASSGAGETAQFEHTLESDVLTNGGIFEDKGRVTLRLAPKDVTSGPLSSNNHVTITRYRVVYKRSDGRNQQGVDVPYAFDGAATTTVGTGNAQATFVLVRVQSKLEAPLITLGNAGGAIVISTIAEVTFYGKDQTGNDVTATGLISVNFADWADPEG